MKMLIWLQNISVIFVERKLKNQFVWVGGRCTVGVVGQKVGIGRRSTGLLKGIFDFTLSVVSTREHWLPRGFG